MSRFFLAMSRMPRPTSTLDKDLQDDKERYMTRDCDKKRDMVCRLIVVIVQGSAHET